MRRALFVVLVLAIPPLAGFTCEIDLTLDEGETCVYWADYNDGWCASDTDLVYCAESDEIVYRASCAGQCPNNDGYCADPSLLGYAACECPSDTSLPPVGSACDWIVHTSEYNACTSGTTLAWCDAWTGLVESVSCSSTCTDGFCDYDYDQGLYNCMCPDYQWAAGYPCNYLEEFDLGECTGDTTLTYCGSDNIIYAAECDAFCQGDPYYATSGSCGTLTGGTYNGCNCVYDVCDFDPYCYDMQFMVYCDATAGAVWLDCDADCVGAGAAKGICQFGACVCS